ncbi:MAG: glycosyltransferase family 2 protein [Muribaculaceae bacterium]|nr:glycosyltransferase family 2 protein [Muribaculaceae bacterium]
MDNRLTVVIPVYNRETELKRCLDSIAAQTMLPAQVIVVDDGSTDNSLVIARTHTLNPVVLQGTHRGAAAARNLGLEKVGTEWTMFFDSDDTMSPNHIASACKAISSDVDLIGWDVRQVTLDNKWRILPFETRDMEWHNIMHGTLATQRYMARTDLFRQAGGWNPEVKIWNDIELGARLLSLSPSVIKIKGVNVNQYHTPVSITGTSWMSNLPKLLNTISILEHTLGNAHPDWLLLKKTILAADIAREAPSHVLPFDTPRELKYRFAYHYRRLGGRGIARLLRPLFSK